MREAGQRLVTLHDSLFDGVVVGPVVDHVPGPVSDLAGGLRGGQFPEPVYHSQLESPQLVGRLARREPRERFTDRLFPHRGRDQKPVTQRDLVHQVTHAKQCATWRGHFHIPACYGRLMQDDTSAADHSEDEREEGDSGGSGISEEHGYEGAGVEQGGGYQRSAEGGGGYEQSGTEGEGYDPRREAEGDG